jgi:hypothetical protein
LLASRCESFIDAEVQQRAVEYIILSHKGPSMVDIMAEMPKFPERQVHVSCDLITIRLIVPAFGICFKNCMIILMLNILFDGVWV